MSKLNYKTSKDYKRLKELLDKGGPVVCIVNNGWNVAKNEPYREICRGEKNEYGRYAFWCYGAEFCAYFPGSKRFGSFEDMCEYMDIEFIEPNVEE
jgi:hypothetical protein